MRAHPNDKVDKVSERFASLLVTFLVLLDPVVYDVGERGARVANGVEQGVVGSDVVLATEDVAAPRTILLVLFAGAGGSSLRWCPTARSSWLGSLGSAAPSRSRLGRFKVLALVALDGGVLLALFEVLVAVFQTAALAGRVGGCARVC
jgi:hypothetical protein